MVHKILSIIFFSSFLFQGCAGFAAGVKEREGISRLGYSIQVGAFAEVKNAERLTAKLQGKGIEAFYFKKETGVYAVRFGDFPSYDAAKRNARKLVAEKMIDSYFIAVPQHFSLKKSPGPELPKGERKGSPVEARRRDGGDCRPHCRTLCRNTLSLGRGYCG